MIARPERPARRLRRLVLESVRQQGCVCSPDIHVTSTGDRLTVTAVYHDVWCALIRTRAEGAGGVPLDVILYDDREGGR